MWPPATPDTPYNHLPPRPPGHDLESKAVLKASITARAASTEPKQAAEPIPDQTMLINTIPLLEAKDSSEIENIVTTTDQLFRHVQGDGTADHATKEALRARLPKIYSRELVDVIFEQPYCRIANLVETDIAERQAASRYLKDLVELGVLREMQYGKEKLSIHPKLMQLLARDSNAYALYA